MNILFYIHNNKSGLDNWLASNLYENLYSKIKELLQYTDINNLKKAVIVFKTQLKWFKKNYSNYKSFIKTIQSALEEYYEIFNTYYDDFHSHNLMKNIEGDYKLIDL